MILSSTVSVNDISSYMFMNELNMNLCFIAAIVVNLLYQDDDAADHYQNFSR